MNTDLSTKTTKCLHDFSYTDCQTGQVFCGKCGYVRCFNMGSITKGDKR